MKIRLILVVLLSLISQNASAQKSIKAGMREIENIYNKNFAYDSSLKINTDYKGEKLIGNDLEGDLQRLFKYSDFDWNISGEHIILKVALRYKVRGRIIDKKSKNPIVGATVLTPYDYTFTDDNGCFEFSFKKGSETLHIKSATYCEQDVEIDIKKNMQLTVELTSNRIFIDEVVVNRQGVEKLPIANINNQGAVAINTKKMKLMPSLTGTQDILKFLQVVPGVSSGSDGSSKIYIRGGLADQTQILLDDAPIYNQSHAFGFVSLFSSESVNSIDIYKSYTSPSVGGRLSGVVDMKIKEGDRNGHNQSIQAGLITLEAAADGCINKGRGSYSLSGRIFTPYLLLQALKSQKLDIPMYNFYDLTAKLIYDINEKHTISLSGYTGSDKMNLTANNNKEDLYIGDQGETYSFNSNLGWGNSIASLKLDSELNDKLSMTNSVYYSSQANNFEHNYKQENNANSTLTNSQSDEIGIRNNFNLKIKPNYSLDFGVNGSYQNFRPQHFISISNGIIGEGENFKKNLISSAIFVNNNIVFGKFDLDLGIHTALYNNGKRTAFSVEPRLSANYKFSDKNSVWASITRNSQPLFSLREQYQYIPVDFWTPFIDDNLQTSKQVNIGGKREFSSSLIFTAELYYKHSNDMGIIYNNEEFLFERLGIERGNGDAYGAEFMVQYSAGRFSATGSYTYSRSTIVIDDIRRDFDFDTPHSANFLTMFRTVEKVNKKHTLALNATYHTGRPFTLSEEVYDGVILGDDGNDANIPWYDDTITNYDPLMTVRLPDYFRADISYSMEKRLRKGSRIWQFSISNVTNRKNPHFIIPINDRANSEFTRCKYNAVTLLPIMPSFSYIRKF